MNEFMCPNGRMSVNGACPIFEGSDGQVKDFNKPKNDFFKFDFENPGENAFEKADNIISKNIEAYNDFVEDKLGISPNVQTAFRIGSTIVTGSLMPFAIPFLGGMALNNSENNRIQNITNQDTQGTINTVVSPSTMNIQPTARESYRGGGASVSSSSSSGSLGSRGSGMSGYGGGADMGGGSPGSSGPGGSDSMGSF